MPKRKYPMKIMGVLERVMGFEPTNGSLGSYCLTAWRHPHDWGLYHQGIPCQAIGSHHQIVQRVSARKPINLSEIYVIWHPENMTPKSKKYIKIGKVYRVL